MPPKPATSRKRTTESRATSTTTKKQKSGNNTIDNINYTKLASEIIRLQDLNKNTKEAMPSDSQTVSNNAYDPTLTPNASSISENPSSTGNLNLTSQVVENETQQNDITKDAAMLVVSLIDKIFSGEVTQTAESVGPVIFLKI